MYFKSSLFDRSKEEASLQNQVNLITGTSGLNKEIFNEECTIDTHVCAGSFW
jgi:hypothetical protein